MEGKYVGTLKWVAATRAERTSGQVSLVELCRRTAASLCLRTNSAESVAILRIFSSFSDSAIS